jgi:hypothetical protein
MAYVRPTNYTVDLSPQEKEEIYKSLKYTLKNFEKINSRFGEDKVNKEIIEELLKDFG